MALVLFAAFVTSVGVPYLLGLFNPVVAGVSDLNFFPEASVLGTVQYFESAVERTMRIRSSVYLSLAFMALGAFGLSIAVFEVVGPGLRNIV